MASPDRSFLDMAPIRSPSMNTGAARLSAVAMDKFRSDPTGMNSSIGRHPLILHFDINKTLIIADSIMNKSTEYTVREVIAQEFWGTKETKTDDAGAPLKPVWRWDGIEEPSLDPRDPESSVSYLRFCRDLDESKENIRLATRSFEYVNDPRLKKKMHDLSDRAMSNMTIPQPERNEELKQKTGLVGEWRLIFPSFFRFIAQLQRQRRQFTIFFRSFGTDLARVRQEWNAFCEMKHPLYNDLLKDVGPMDGSVPGVPDRRLGDEDTHTMYRDADGPVLMLGVATNGKCEGAWDAWSRSGATEDTRKGRDFMKQQGFITVQGYVPLQAWFQEQLQKSKSHILREDFAWWHWNGEVSTAGKLLIGIDRVQQVFFDDNVGVSSFRIVDPRSAATFMPKGLKKCMGAACIRVDALKAMLDDNYYIGAFSKSDRRPDALWKDDLGDLGTDEGLKDDLGDLGDMFGARSSIKTDSAALAHFAEGKRAQTLVESSDESSDSSEEDQGETLTITDVQSLREILQAEGVDLDRFGAPGTTYKSVQNLYQELTDGKCCIKKVATEVGNFRVQRSMQVMRVKLMCNNMVLCETHEQLPDGRLRSRSGYLPGSKVRQNETLDQTFDRWAVEELQLNVTEEQKREALKSVMHTHDVTEETLSYPLPCATHYLEVCCILEPSKMNQVLLDRLGLPAGSMFSTRGLKRGKSGEMGRMRFWSWYRAGVWEAMTNSREVELPDVAAGMEQLFQGHPRRGAYESLLLQMFDCFSAQKLCGGLSGSLVLQVQPVDPLEGRNEETVCVKLDKADVVSRELANSRRVWQALQDRAARVLGQGCFFTDSAAVEYGAFKIELAGGCWQVPELAQAGGSKDLLSTFKDLFTVESERQLLHTDMHHLVSTSGDIEVVLLELMGPGGMLRVLRREGLGRSPNSLLKSYNYNGKDTKWNPLYSGNFQLKPMQELWRRTFGRNSSSYELPDVRKQVQALRDRFAKLEDTPIGKYRPLMGLAHGDLNAMNVLIDVMDAVWIIDFAFSEEKPLCWDLSKLEIAFMFEYAVLPVHWKTLLAFAGDNEQEWRDRKVCTWLNVSEKVALLLLEELCILEQGDGAESVVPGFLDMTIGDQSMPLNSMYSIMNSMTFGSMGGGRCMTDRCMTPLDSTVAPLHGRGSKRPQVETRLPKRRSTCTNTQEYHQLALAIRKAIDRAYKEPLDRASQKKRDTEFCRLSAALLTMQEEEDTAMEFAAATNSTMLHGGSLTDMLERPPTAAHCGNSESINFCWTKAARLRLFFKQEWMELQRRVLRELGPLQKADESPLVFLLGLLQESYRLLGYFDVAPWVKCWAIHYLELLLARINTALDEATDALERLELPDSARLRLAKSVDLEPRDYPSDLCMAHRALAQCSSKPVTHSTRARIREIHDKTKSIKQTGGLFGEIRNVKEVRRGGAVMHGELVRDTGGSTGSMLEGLLEEEADGPSESCSLLYHGGGMEIQIGMVTVVTDELVSVSLKVPVVPLGEKSLSAQERRRGIRASGRLPGGDAVVVVLSVIDAVFCYPRGARLRLAPNAPLRPGVRLRYATVLHLNERSGNYIVCYDNASKNHFEDTEADPYEGNHLAAPPAPEYKEGTQLSVYLREAGGFVCRVVHRRLKDTSSVHSSNVTRVIYRLKDPSDPDNADKKVNIDLNDFNHARCHGCLDAASFDEEVRRYKVFAKAKHSFIYTVTSKRADALAGPVPRVADEKGRELFFWSEMQSLISEDDDRMTSHMFFQGILILGEPGSGKSCVLCKLAMHCLSHSTMLLPVLIPVSDLSKRLHKAEQRSSVAIQALHDDNGIANYAEGLVDWYLRMVFGGDTPRYFMLRQALECHRLLLLFDGLEEAGQMSSRIEECLLGLVALDHRVVVTARQQEEDTGPSKSGPGRQLRGSHVPSSIASKGAAGLLLQLFRTMELLPLEMDCRRSLVEALFTHEVGTSSPDDVDAAVNFVEDFIDNLDEDEEHKWSTPMMVAMLVASWHEKMRQDKIKETNTPKRKRHSSRTNTFTGGSGSRAGSKAIGSGDNAFALDLRALGSEGQFDSSGNGGLAANIREVYHVALDLLLRRFQSRQQADRHKMKDTVQKFKMLLQLIAVKMTDEGTKAFTELDVIPLLRKHGIEEEVWKDLADAIRGGRVPLLQARTEEDCHTERFLFAYGSFQNFLFSEHSRNAPAPHTLLSAKEPKGTLNGEQAPGSSSLPVPPPPHLEPTGMQKQATLWDVFSDLWQQHREQQDAVGR